MIANGDRSDNRIVQSDAGIVADNDIAHGVVDAAERFHHTVPTQCKASVGRGIHPDGRVYLGSASPMLVEWSQ